MFAVLFQTRAAESIEITPQFAVDSIRHAARFYRREAATHGGYVYYYSLDLTRRWGEGEASRDQIWVQSPGTPRVAEAFLRAYEITRDTYCLDAAVDAAVALTYGQLRSGGWTNCIDFDPAGERIALYRDGPSRGKDNSTLDDGITQGAISFLARVDHALDFKHERIHTSVRTALDALLAAQFPNGAFPQVWTSPVTPQAVRSPAFPTYDWRTEGRVKNYWDMYTLNDRVAGEVARTLSSTHTIYGEPRLAAALARLGDFLILSQMPDPQPAWAQQYSYEMFPIWARKFEPPAIASHESQDVLLTLMFIYESTREEKYLAPVPRAVAYLRRSLLSDGRLARYYELKTNRPLYMKRDGTTYELTYDDVDLPGHYGWKIDSRLDEIESRLRTVRRGPTTPKRAGPGGMTILRAREAVESLDDRGRWVSTYAGEGLVGQPKFRDGDLYISSDVFARNIEALCAYVEASR